MTGTSEAVFFWSATSEAAIFFVRSAATEAAFFFWECRLLGGVSFFGMPPLRRRFFKK